MREARILLLVVVSLIVGPAAARKYYTDRPAFVASAMRSRTSSALSSPQRDTTWRSSAAAVSRQEQQQPPSRLLLLPRCHRRGWERAAFSAPRRRRRVVVASSSGLQEPLERVAAVSGDQDGEGAARHARSLRRQQQQQQQQQQPVAMVAPEERQRERRAGRTAHDSHGCGDASNAQSIYGAPGGGDGEEVAGANSIQPAAIDYGFEFEDEEDVDIYLPGGMGAGLRPGFKPRKSKPPAKWSKAVRGSSRFRVVLAGREDLDEAGALCIKVFFGEPDSPWKAAQLRQLTREQGQDLESRCNRKESVMFKAIDARRNNAMIGFVEVSETSGSKYGMGSGVPIADTRPVVSNLAVDPLARRFGIGTALMDACEDLVKTWQFEEIILQVEEDNEAALAFYNGLGFNTLFVDRAARRYDTSGFLLQNVRTSKLTMRKPLDSSASEARKPGDTFGDHVAHLFRFLAEPFAVPPPPSARLPARSVASVENLFGPSRGGGGRGAGVRRWSGGSGGRLGSSRSDHGSSVRGTASSDGYGSGAAKARRLYAGSSNPSSSSSSSSSSSAGSEEVAPVRLHRTTRRR